MRCADIITKIEGFYPTAYACDWDHTGIQAGRLEKEVTRIYVALDATEKVIREAVQKDSDMIITHHPMIFSPLYSITNNDANGARVIEILQHDMCCYSIHTNYDVISMADLSSQILGLKDTEVLENIDTSMIPESISVGSGPMGIGRVGALPLKMSLRDCCELVKTAFGLPSVNVYGDLGREVGRAALSPGSGRSMIGAAAEKAADVLITGDIGHHEGLTAMELGVSVIDAGHYGLEHIFIKDMMDFLRLNIPETVIFGEDISLPCHVV